MFVHMRVQMMIGYVFFRNYSSSLKVRVLLVPRVNWIWIYDNARDVDFCSETNRNWTSGFLVIGNMLWAFGLLKGFRLLNIKYFQRTMLRVVL